jgi:hypothetical protein
MLDATAMLWRLQLRDIDVGSRWKELADKWEARAGDLYYAFNDMHAMMSFIGDGRAAAVRKLLKGMEQRAKYGGTNAMMTRDVGLPVCQAIAAYADGDYSKTVDLLLPVRPIANRFGGSHAQRDAAQHHQQNRGGTARQPVAAGSRAGGRAHGAEALQPVQLDPDGAIPRWLGRPPGRRQRSRRRAIQPHRGAAAGGVTFKRNCIDGSPPLHGGEPRSICVQRILRVRGGAEIAEGT